MRGPSVNRWWSLFFLIAWPIYVLLVILFAGIALVIADRTEAWREVTSHWNNLIGRS